VTIERRDAWNGTALANSASSSTLANGEWYTLRLVHQDGTLSADAYLGQVDPATATPFASTTAIDNTYTRFTHVSVNGGYVFETDNLRVTIPAAN
jgi:hypothetical protein